MRRILSLLLLALTLALTLAAPASAQVTLPDASDRFAWSPAHRHAAALTGRWTLGAALALDTVVTLRGDHRARDGWRQACTLGLAQGIVQTAKLTVRKTRPDRSDRRSFFSGDTASAPRWFLAIPVGVFRVGAAKHDWMDALIGVADSAGSRYLCERWIR